MRDILQITGFIYTAIIAIVVDVIAILRFKSSNKDDEAKSLLAKEILMGSTFAIVGSGYSVTFIFAFLNEKSLKRRK